MGVGGSGCSLSPKDGKMAPQSHLEGVKMHVCEVLGRSQRKGEHFVSTQEAEAKGL